MALNNQIYWVCSLTFNSNVAVFIQNDTLSIPQVATNGFLSLQLPPKESQYLKTLFPLSFSAIAPFLTDISSGHGKGSVFYRVEESIDVLNRASEMVQQGFTGSTFKSSHTVIATWDNVACEEDRLLQSPFTHCVTLFFLTSVSKCFKDSNILICNTIIINITMLFCR